VTDFDCFARYLGATNYHEIGPGEPGEFVKANVLIDAELWSVSRWPS